MRKCRLIGTYCRYGWGPYDYMRVGDIFVVKADTRIPGQISEAAQLVNFEESYFRSRYINNGVDIVVVEYDGGHWGLNVSCVEMINDILEPEEYKRPIRWFTIGQFVYISLWKYNSISSPIGKNGTMRTIAESGRCCRVVGVTTFRDCTIVKLDNNPFTWDWRWLVPIPISEVEFKRLVIC